MTMGVRLCPTPPERLCDAAGRPYFLWDVDVDLAALRRKLADPDPEVRAYWTGKVLRQAKPDDALTLLTPEEIRDRWPGAERYLGRERPFWAWLLRRWFGDEIERR